MTLMKKNNRNSSDNRENVQSSGKERKGKERRGKEREGKERKGKERGEKGKRRESTTMKRQ